MIIIIIVIKGLFAILEKNPARVPPIPREDPSKNEDPVDPALQSNAEKSNGIVLALHSECQ